MISNQQEFIEYIEPFIPKYKYSFNCGENSNGYITQCYAQIEFYKIIHSVREYSFTKTFSYRANSWDELAKISYDCLKYFFGYGYFIEGDKINFKDIQG